MCVLFCFFHVYIINHTVFLVQFSGSCNFSFLKKSHVQINSKLNSKPYNYLQSHFNWICPSVNYYRLFRTPAISNTFALQPLRVRNNGVQLCFPTLALSYSVPVNLPGSWPLEWKHFPAKVMYLAWPKSAGKNTLRVTELINHHNNMRISSLKFAKF